MLSTPKVVVNVDRIVCKNQSLQIHTQQNMDLSGYKLSFTAQQRGGCFQLSVDLQPPRDMDMFASYISAQDVEQVMEYQIDLPQGVKTLRLLNPYAEKRQHKNINVPLRDASFL